MKEVIYVIIIGLLLGIIIIGSFIFVMNHNKQEIKENKINNVVMI